MKRRKRCSSCYSDNKPLNRIVNEVRADNIDALDGYIWCSQNTKGRWIHIKQCLLKCSKERGSKGFHEKDCQAKKDLVKFMYLRGRACQVRKGTWVIF